MTYANITISLRITEVAVEGKKGTAKAVFYTKKKDEIIELPIVLELYGKAVEKAQKVLDENKGAALVTGEVWKESNITHISVDNITEALKQGISYLTAIGYVGTQPEHTTTKQGGYCKSSVAVNKYQKETTWVNFTAFGKTGETISKFINKGSFLTVVGRLDAYVTDKGPNWSLTVNKVVLMPKSLAKGGAEPAAKQETPKAEPAATADWDNIAF